MSQVACHVLVVACACLDGIMWPRADISCVVAASKYLEDEKRIVCVCVCVCSHVCWCMIAFVHYNRICVCVS
jgi:hypothetical protein